MRYFMRFKMKKLIYPVKKWGFAQKALTIAALALAITIFADISASFAYSNPDFFLKQGVGARQLGMGNAGTAVADDASAIFFNPAGLAFMKNVEVTTMHSEAYDFDIKYDYLSLILPLVHGRVIGASGALLKTDQIPITKDKIPNIVNYTEDKEQVGMFSYGHKISERAALGLTVKDIKQKLYFKEANGTEADFALLYKPSKTINFGINVQDALPSELKWSTGVTDDIPVTVRGGMAIKLRDWGSLIAIDADKVKGRDVKLNAGWEYQFNETFLGRAGVNDGQGTAGFSLTRGGWRFDYAYMRAELGEVQRFSATARFGSFLFENLLRKYRRPTTPQCDDPDGKMSLQSRAVCKKGHIDAVSGCASCNSSSKIAAYPSASKRNANQIVKLGATDRNPSASFAGSKSGSGRRLVSAAEPQPDINKVLGKDESPVVEIPRASGVRKPDEKIREGNKLVLAGRNDEAVKAYREALNMKPNSEEAHVKLAGIYQYQKLYGEAIEEYKDAIAINPTNADNYISIASLYAKIGEFDKASEACEIVTKMAPGTDKAKIANNLYETFKRQATPPDNKLKLTARNISSLNIEEEEVTADKLNIDSYDEEKPKKSVKKSSTKTKKKTVKATKTAKKTSATKTSENLLDN